MAGLWRSAAAQGPLDALVQAPTFKQPERGSLAGSLAKFSIGAEDVSRGSFDLSLPMEVPSERGGLLAPVLPSYASENGISEWGIGWSAGLAIQRFRVTGDVDYQTDEFTSPWGRLQQGTDGLFYPAGLKTAMRLEKQATGWVATDPSGTAYEFRRVVSTPEGPYAWYLTRVETVLGDAATVDYVNSTGGRPFVNRVVYGGRGDAETYRLNFEYDTLPAALVDYRSGHALHLDRRVSGVVAWAKEGGAGTYRKRWRYDVTYRDSAFGPGFHLDSVMRTFASGEVEPPVTYDYDLPELATPAGLAFRTGPLEDAPGIQSYLALTDDPDGVQPDHAAATDVNDDGLTDLEHGHDFTLYRQTSAGGYVAEELPPAPPGSDPDCRPPPATIDRARTLVRMAGPNTSLQVLVLDSLSSTTQVRVCDRAGTPRFTASVSGHWLLGANTKIVDLNRDDRPDMLLVDTGQYEVLENISGDGCAPGSTTECVPFGFRHLGAVELGYVNGFPFTPSASWAHDMNGDGNPDLVQRTADRISIWYGRGRFRFESERQLAVLNRDGNEVLDLDAWEVTWVDANKDGLTDALMSIGQESALFINEGDSFREAVSPLLDGANLNAMGVPLVGDLRARGDLDLVFVGQGDVSASGLTEPSSGLLVSADDGKGSLATFAYERAAAAPGLRQRPSLLHSLTMATAGYEPVTYQYTYAAPRMHGVGHFLLGFGAVEVQAPQSSQKVDFYHDDQVAGQIDAERSFDARTPGLMRFSRTTYGEALHAGVRVRRPQASTTGWCTGTDVIACASGASPSATELTEFLVYQRGMCPTQTRTTNRYGKVVIETTLASPAQLSAALHCIAGGRVWTGTHSDPTRNFRLESRLGLNDFGQTTKLEQLGGGETLTLQEVVYDATTHRIASVSSPGEGSQTFTYDGETGQLDSVTGKDGVVASAQNRDPRTDALLELVGDRGAGGVLTSSFRYDGMERLTTRWADFGGSSSSQPFETVDYQFPTTDFPALIQVSSLVDAVAGTRRQSAEWTYPDGAAMATATHVPGRWVFGGVSTNSRTDLRTRSLRRAPLLDSADVALQTYTTILAETTQLGESLGAGFGHSVSSRDVIQQGVERAVANTIALSSGLLVATARENDTLESKTAVDAVGRLAWVRDQKNATTQYQYDALGRLISVTLPDGTRQKLSFDVFGRPAQVVRDGIGAVVYAYEPVTSRLDRKEYRDPTGAVVRAVDLTYDDIGRVIEHKHSAGAAEARFAFGHDGDVGDGEVVPGQKGYATRIEGPSYTVTTVRNPDGTEASSSLVMTGWMQIDTSTTYHASGAIKDDHRIITRLADGAVIDDVTTGHVLDAAGRLQRVTVNGDTLATIYYDNDGRIEWVDVAGGQRIDHFYDPVTHRQSGYNQSSGGEEFGVDWTFNDRGLVASEAIGLVDQSWLRSYRYDPRGFLSRSEDAAGLSTYTYTTTGLPSQVTDERGTRTVFRGSATSLNVDGIQYTWDATGRLIKRGAATFTYGADGHLAQAVLGARTVRYDYDADGNRLIKRENGSPVAGYLGGGYLTNESFIAPVDIGGRLVGVLEDGQFHLLAADPRGTVLADLDGTPRLPTPYGVRSIRPNLAAAIDYVEKAYDADLDSVRMGVRDYDPLLSQFWTPDPLFLEAIDKCAASPIECNLVGYARNNPVSFVDPTGTCVGLSCLFQARDIIESVGDAGERLASATGAPGRLARRIGERIGEGFDAVAGVGHGLGVPGLGDGPAFGNEDLYYGGVMAGAGAGLAIDAKAIVAGGGMVAGGGACTVTTAGACAPVGVPVAAVGGILIGAGAGLTTVHGQRMAEGLNHFRKDASGTQAVPVTTPEKRGWPRISNVAPDWGRKGAHIHVGKVELAVRPAEGGKIVFTPFFARDARRAWAAMPAAVEALKDIGFRQRLFNAASRALQTVEGGRGAELRFLMVALQKMGL